MITFSARPATPPHTPQSLPDPGRGARFKRGLWPIAFTANIGVVVLAAAVTASIVWPGATQGAAVTLTSNDGIDLGQGISVTPAPGWTIANQGPGWVALHNAYSTAEMEFKVKSAVGTDVVAVLQADVDQLTHAPSPRLTNVRNVSAPSTRTLQSANFQQEASIEYNADGSTGLGTTPVVGTFTELLNTSTHQSAFIVFAQNQDAPIRADSDGTLMLQSMQ